MEIIVVVALVVGFYMAWNIGANDVANSMADAVGSKALTVFWAVILAGICNFLGAVLVGGHVTDTVRSEIIDTQAFAQDPQVLAHDLRQFRQLIATDAPLTIESRLVPGNRVRVRHGLFAGLEGTVLKRRGGTRLVVCVNFLQQGASVEVDDFMLEPIA